MIATGRGNPIAGWNDTATAGGVRSVARAFSALVVAVLASCDHSPPPPADAGIDAPLEIDAGSDAGPPPDCSYGTQQPVPDGQFRCSPTLSCDRGAQGCCVTTAPDRCLEWECRDRALGYDGCAFVFACNGPRDCAADELCCANEDGERYCVDRARGCEHVALCDADADCPADAPCCVVKEGAYCRRQLVDGSCP